MTWGQSKATPAQGAPSPAQPYLEAAVHHADDEVELLVVQHGAVLLHVQVKLLGQAVPGGPALHGTQHSWEQLGEKWGWGAAWGLHSTQLQGLATSALVPWDVVRKTRAKVQVWPAGHGQGGREEPRGTGR